MKLKELLDKLNLILPLEVSDQDLIKICSDSRAVVPGSIFFCINGEKFNGNNFVNNAITQGASLIISEEHLDLKNYIQVKNIKNLYALALKYFYSDPSNLMKIVGITGTNGKTTINHLLYQALSLLDKTAVRLGTLGIFSKIHKMDSLTTPDPETIQKVLSEASEVGIEYGILEVSSHGLSQARVAGVAFDLAIFTNLTRDHLDYHEDLEEYFQAKLKLFKQLKGSTKKTTAIICTDSEYGQRVKKYCEENNIKSISYGVGSADYLISNIQQVSANSSFVISFKNQQITINTKLLGIHNALNLTAVYLTLLTFGFAQRDLLNVLSKLEQAPGRFEVVWQSPSVIVDYAHTPDAMENVLGLARKNCQAKLWVIFGCGGDRDRGKRPEMAKVAAKYADYVVLTSDNPRTEDPQQIVNDILISKIKPEIVELDRKKAIFKVLKRCDPNDLIMILGKGHEDYQIIGTEKIHFLDAEVVREFYQDRL